MKFTKMQGIGNDYVYVNCFEEEVRDPAAAAVLVSDRHFGIGSDGLILIKPSQVADFKMEIYNADGSQAQMCGNGIRCVAKYVYDFGLTDKKQISVETGAGIKYLDLTVMNGKVRLVRVDMGAPILNAADIPVVLPLPRPDAERMVQITKSEEDEPPIACVDKNRAESKAGAKKAAAGEQMRMRASSAEETDAAEKEAAAADEQMRTRTSSAEAITEEKALADGQNTQPSAAAENRAGETFAEEISISDLHVTAGPSAQTRIIGMACPVAGGLYPITCVSMGNPHCVVPWPRLDDLEIEKVGPAFENDPMFPERVNTEFIEVIDRTHVRMRVWERGSGETLACGTGSCAAAVACILNGWTDHEVTIKLRGGDLKIEWDGEGSSVFMTGPAAVVFTGEIQM